jgi:hypothetical protein
MNLFITKTAKNMLFFDKLWFIFCFCFLFNLTPTDFGHLN